MNVFTDRFNAGMRLLEKIGQYQGSKGVILAIPRGGLEVGYVLSKETGMPLEVILTKKIGHPSNSEYAIGSVSLHGRIITHSEFASQEYIEEETKRIRKNLVEKYKMYLDGRTPLSLEGKTVIITDDGVATGSTMFAAIELVRQSNPEKIIVAIPVAPLATLEKLELVADEVICELPAADFTSVGQFYEYFNQVSDEEAIELLRKANYIRIKQ